MKRIPVMNFLMLAVLCLAMAACGGSGGSAPKTSTGTIPPAPTGVTAAAGNGQVEVTWREVSGATSYNVYWSGSAGVTKSNGTRITGAASPYVHPGLTNGTPYHYVVTAVGSGGESDESAEVTATPRAAEGVVYAELFEAGNGNYMADGTAGWAWRTPPEEVGSAPAASGQTCWGTYPASGAGTVEGNIYSPTVALPRLSAGQVVRVVFYAYLDVNYEKYGEGDFYISTDGKQAWELLGRYYEKMAGGWQRYVYDISAYAGKPVNFRFRVYMEGTDRGMYIDNVSVMTENIVGPSKLLTLEASEDADPKASCPWVFTWDGTKFVKDNDIYSVARYPQGEMSDFYLLQKQLAARNGTYDLEIREIESEDSWTDYLGLRAVDHPHDVAVAPDGKGNISAYRPAQLVSPLTAASNSGTDVIAQIRSLDGSGFNAYSGDFLDVDFGTTDVSQGARVVLRARGFNRGAGVDKPFIGPPAIVVQIRDGQGNWQEVGRLNPRFEWSTAAFDLSSYLPDRDGRRTIRLASISHGAIYHEIDFVALATGPQPQVTVTGLPLVSAVRGNADVSALLSASDNRYVQLGTGNSFAAKFGQLPQKRGYVRDFILVSEGYYIPRSNTFFIYTWDGTQWLQQGSYSFMATDSVRTFDLSSVLPDPDGEYKVRIWQDYANWPAAIDYVGFKVGGAGGILQSATDLRDGTGVISLVGSSDDIRLMYPLNDITHQPRNRWTEYRWNVLP